MEPMLQFDPANLSIWYNPVQHEKDTSLDQLNQIARQALLGYHAKAFDLGRAVDDPVLQVRVAHLLSAICHEQRHFVDVVLTNFGQSMIRQFTSLLVNVPSALNDAKAAGRLALPVTIYSDAVKRRAMKVEGNENLIQIARDVRSRIKMMKPDVFEHTLAIGGTVSVGGRAQLEALAYITQMTVLQNEFGFEIARAVQDDMPDHLHLRNQYQWAAILGVTLGLIPPGERTEGRLIVLGSAICALLYGALMVRRWGQEQSEVKDGNSCLRRQGLIRSSRTFVRRMHFNAPLQRGRHGRL